MGEQVAVEVVVVPHEGVLEVVAYAVEGDAGKLLVERPVVEAVHEYVQCRDHGGGTQQVGLLRQCEAAVVATCHVLLGVQVQTALLLAVVASIVPGQSHFANHAAAEKVVVVIVAGVAVACCGEEAPLVVQLILQIQTGLQGVEARGCFGGVLLERLDVEEAHVAAERQLRR